MFKPGDRARVKTMSECVFDEAYQREGLVFGDVPSEEIAEYLNNHELSGNALDIGCGEGRDTLFLAEYGFHVTALDLSRVGIQKLISIVERRGFADRIDAIVTDVRTWNYPKDYFDLVISVTCLDHLPKEDLPVIVRNITLCMRDSGILFVEVYTTDDPGCSGDALASEFADQILHYFEPNELLRVFMPYVRVLRYEEKCEWDYDHGEPHQHGVATLLAMKYFAKEC